MAGYKQDTKLMAKNSAFMYIQMAVKMLIGLYTVRVILHALGAEDYGIYNVVGGFVTMFTYITSTMMPASMRFYAYALAKEDRNLLNRYFNSMILCYAIMAIVIFVIVEVLGYWFVNYKMVIPANRLEAANWVLQFALISFFTRFIAVPYKGMIMLYEKMIYYSFISVIDSFLLLVIAFLIQIVEFDRLKFYSFCIFSVAFISTLMYVTLCNISFRDSTKINIKWESSLLKELLSYSVWYMFGTMTTVVRSQGINVLLNLFFNPVVNAARGIAYQINNAITQFANSFYNAIRPQITKLTAAEENKKMLSLVFDSSIISFLLICLIALPLLIEMPFVLSLWLGEVPKYTIIFSRLVILTVMIDTLGYPLNTAILTTGKIRNFQIITGITLIMCLPISYWLLKVWHLPYLVFGASVFFSLIVHWQRLLFMKKMFNMSIMNYIHEVVLRLMLIMGISLFITYFLRELIGDATWSHFMVIIMSIIFVIILSWFVGLRQRQRDMIIGFVSKKLMHKR